MTSKKVNQGISFLIILFLALSLFTACSKESRIQAEIDKANYCVSADDCVLIGNKCPFGCYIYVHKDESARIKEIVDPFKSKCVYSCIQCQSVACIEGKCQSVCGPDDQILPN